MNAIDAATTLFKIFNIPPDTARLKPYVDLFQHRIAKQDYADVVEWCKQDCVSMPNTLRVKHIWMLHTGRDPKLDSNEPGWKNGIWVGLDDDGNTNKEHPMDAARRERQATLFDEEGEEDGEGTDQT